MNIEARIRELERVLAPSQDHRWHQVTGSSVECEAAREAMIASGQATRSDRFVYRVIVTPAQSPFMQQPASLGDVMTCSAISACLAQPVSISWRFRERGEGYCEGAVSRWDCGPSSQSSWRSSGSGAKSTS